MENSKKINFNGGYIELYIPSLPLYKFDGWKVKILGKIVASDEATTAEGKRILFEKGFSSNGNKINEFYKTVTILDDL
ncbi:hypothetical protein ABE872_09975 [Enterococcus gallinarum]|uniref:hypothetical protein n=1 Tax=Enterococcus gallinarum TaxID=1353 RepID=UPI003D6BC0E4